MPLRGIGPTLLRRYGPYGCGLSVPCRRGRTSAGMPGEPRGEKRQRPLGPMARRAIVNGHRERSQRYARGPSTPDTRSGAAERQLPFLTHDGGNMSTNGSENGGNGQNEPVDLRFNSKTLYDGNDRA